MSVLPAAGTPQKVDPDQLPVVCEAPGCGASLPRAKAIAFHVALAMRGGDLALYPGEVAPDAFPVLHCPAEQHIACSIEHAALVAHACMDEHIAPLHAAQVAAATQHQHDAKANQDAAKAALLAALAAKKAQDTILP